MKRADPDTAPEYASTPLPASGCPDHPVQGDVATGIERAVAVLQAARTPLLLCHRSPDGDTIGAALALAEALRALGRSPTIACADPLPPSLLFVPDSQTVGHAVGEQADLLVTVDISDPAMLGELRADVERLRGSRTLLNIDHHASDTEYGDLNVVDVTAASTAEIVFDLVAKLGVPISQTMATALLTGIINDTHSFQNANTSPRAMQTAASLVSSGADPATITYHLLLRRRPQAALLWGQTLATMRFDDDGHVLSAFATAEMVAQCAAEPADLDGIVEFMRNVDGVDLAFLLKGAGENLYKASVRTTTRVDAVDLTAPFGGGGHRRAAGCDLTGTPDSARAALLRRYDELVGKVPPPP